MPTIQSAKKRARQNVKLRVAKGGQRNRVVTAVKKTLRLITDNKISDARKSFVLTQKLMDSSVNKKLFHKNKISRLKARISRRIKLLDTNKKNTVGIKLAKKTKPAKQAKPTKKTKPAK